MSDADLTALYRRWLLDLWHASPADRADIAREVVTEDFTVRRAGQPEEPRGPIRLVALVEAGSAPFDDVRQEIAIGPLVDGDLVAARWIFRGRYRGGLPGASAPRAPRSPSRAWTCCAPATGASPSTGPARTGCI